MASTDQGGTDRDRVRDTETPSLRVEEGKPELPTPAERMAEVPLAFHSGGVLGHGPEEPPTEYERELDAARQREERRES